MGKRRKSNETIPLRVDTGFGEILTEISQASKLSVREVTRRLSDDTDFGKVCVNVVTERKNELEDALESLRPYPKARFKK